MPSLRSGQASGYFRRCASDTYGVCTMVSWVIPALNQGIPGMRHGHPLAGDVEQGAHLGHLVDEWARLAAADAGWVGARTRADGTEDEKTEQQARKSIGPEEGLPSHAVTETQPVLVLRDVSG